MVYNQSAALYYYSFNAAVLWVVVVHLHKRSCNLLLAKDFSFHSCALFEYSMGQPYDARCTMHIAHTHSVEWKWFPYIYIDNEMNMKHVHKRHNQSISGIQTKKKNSSHSLSLSSNFSKTILLAKSYSIFDCNNILIPFVYKYIASCSQLLMAYRIYYDCSSFGFYFDVTRIVDTHTN